MSGFGNLGPFSRNPHEGDEREARFQLPFRKPLPMLESARKSILLVYPEKDITSLYSRQLSCFVRDGQGGEIRAAGNFRDALDLARKNRFDVAVVGEGIPRSAVSGLVGESEICGHELVRALCWGFPGTSVVLETRNVYYIYGSGNKQPTALEKGKFSDPEIAFQHAVALALHPPQKPEPAPAQIR